MRLGKNDRKVHTPPQPTRVTAVVVTYVPEETGYFQDRLAVIKLSLASLVQHADLPMDLMVFDNASCRSLQNSLCSLKDEGVIKYLILSSKNIGLAGAYRIIAGAAPGDIIAFANDDVFYYPNWLSPQIEIIDKFPDVGLVSGFYLRGTHPRIAQIASEKGMLVKVVPAPETWINEFCIGASYPSPEFYYQAQVAQGWTDLEDRMIFHNDKCAYAGGVCWQAVFRKETLLKLLPTDDPKVHGWPSYDGYFHNEIIRQGYLRLSTTERYVTHIGNVLTPEIANLARQYGLGIHAKPISQEKIDFWRRVMNINGIRKAITKLYNWAYKLLKASELKR